MKKIYSEINISTAIWWIVLITLFLIVPLIKVHGITIECNEEVLRPVWWMYLVGVFIYDWVFIILMIAVSMVGMLLAKLHNYLTKGE